MALSILEGIPVSPGVAIGKAFYMDSPDVDRPRAFLPESHIAEETLRLEKAFKLAAKGLEEVRKRVPAELKEHALIIDSHLMMLQDPKLLGAAKDYIQEIKINAEWALEKAVGDLESIFKSIDDDYFRERIGDIRMVAKRVQEQLAGQYKEPESIKHKAVLLAKDISPAETTMLDVRKILACGSSEGGKASHMGIMARTLGIPAVVGLAKLDGSEADGKLVIVDGIHGKLIISPDKEELRKYGDLKRRFEGYQKRILRTCRLPGETPDGYRIKVMANLEFFEDASIALEYGSEGVGLYRTEYSYMNRPSLPSEEELYKEYVNMASSMAPREVILRTLDLGADKNVPGIPHLNETNPALGLRAIRLCLNNRKLFKTQIRAMLRAAVLDNVSIMFPMISSLMELRQAKGIIKECQNDLLKEELEFGKNVPIGVMIELPAAVMIAETLAKEVDFFSIGTNDLAQYILGVDRTNSHVSSIYQPLHPAVIHSIKWAVDAAHQAGIEVNICGEMAADPYCLPILIGMRIDSVSLPPLAIPTIKHIMRHLTVDDCKTLLQRALKNTSSTWTNRDVRDTIFDKFPDDTIDTIFYSTLLENNETSWGTLE